MTNAICSSEENLRNPITSRGSYLDLAIHFCRKNGILSRDPVSLTACLGLDELGEQGEAARLLDEHPVLLGLAEGPQGVRSATRHLKYSQDYCCQGQVLRIHDILLWIRIWIRGSIPLTSGSGFGSRSCFFRH
jgi:hypothetical protein